MRINQELRDQLVSQMEAAFLEITTQVDRLFDCTSFYLDRYPCETAGDVIRTYDIQQTVGNLALIVRALGETITELKRGLPRTHAAIAVEISVLNELWSNITALVHFLISSGIDLDPYSPVLAGKALDVLLRTNRLLT